MNNNENRYELIIEVPAEHMRNIFGMYDSHIKKLENGTEKFYSDLEPVLETRQGFEPGQIDKFTIVIYLEGDDPDCIDALIGGEMKMHMDITEEHITKTN